MRLIEVLHRPRLLAGALIAACAAAIATGLFVQHGLGYEPCSLCVLQRLGFMGVLAAAVLLVALPGTYALSVVLAASVVAMTLGGLAVASYQVWLQAFPPLLVACGRGLGAIFEGWPFEAAFRWVFDSQGDCAKPVSPLGIVSLAQLGLVAFLLMSAAAVRLLRLTARGARTRQ
jgi:disulfide bond formation protein DsbB